VVRRVPSGLGRLARSGDLLAIIAARARLLLSAKQDLLRNGDPTRDVPNRFPNYGKDMGSHELSRKREDGAPLSFNVGARSKYHASAN
jgi:hypothetical protein